ncbi:MAG TPA: hypothetical protein GX006_04005 [Clostridiales bacterium]|nr:hypothetical protein [Clostridiales bacterium]
MKKQRKRYALLLLSCLFLAAIWPGILADESAFSAWKKMEIGEGAIADVNYRRSMLDEKGREIRVQEGLGTSPHNVLMLRDATNRYEESEEGLIKWQEQIQFDETGKLILLIKAKFVNDVQLEAEWFNPEGKRTHRTEVDPVTGITHTIAIRDWLKTQMGVVQVSEIFLPKGEGRSLSEVMFNYDAAGKLVNAKHYVYNKEKNSVRQEPYDGTPSEAVLEMVKEWFGN